MGQPGAFTKGLSALLCAMSAACAEPDPPLPPLRFFHTFSPSEAQAVAATLPAPESIAWMPVPFARGRNALHTLLAQQATCPDVLRIDATWLDELVAVNALRPVPSQLQSGSWTQVLVELARRGTETWAIPHTIDGLVVVRAPHAPEPPSATLAAFTAAVASQATLVRADGYWLVPWLRANHVALPPATADATQIQRLTAALASFAEIAGPRGATVPLGQHAEAAAFASGQLRYWIAGSWQVPAGATVSALPLAPLGAQLLAVPRCATQPERSWALIAALVAPAALAKLGGNLLPALAPPPPAMAATAAALATATPLPANILTPRMFDDAGPALWAVISGDATAAEAATGLATAWQQLERLPP